MWPSNQKLYIVLLCQIFKRKAESMYSFKAKAFFFFFENLIPKWCQTSTLMLISCAVNPGPCMESLQVKSLWVDWGTVRKRSLQPSMEMYYLVLMQLLIIYYHFVFLLFLNQTVFKTYHIQILSVDFHILKVYVISSLGRPSVFTKSGKRELFSVSLKFGWILSWNTTFTFIA